MSRQKGSSQISVQMRSPSIPNFAHHRSRCWPFASGRPLSSHAVALTSTILHHDRQQGGGLWVGTGWGPQPRPCWMRGGGEETNQVLLGTTQPLHHSIIILRQATHAAVPPPLHTTHTLCYDDKLHSKLSCQISPTLLHFPSPRFQIDLPTPA